MSDRMNRWGPATPFMQGYRRSPEIEAQLLGAIAKALREHPTMRFGQLVINLLGSDPWHVWDEQAIEIMNAPSTLPEAES